MTATNHGIFGAVIAISLQKYPAAAIAVAPFSHFLLDALPHSGGFEDNRSKSFFAYLLTDMSLAVISTLTLAWFWPQISLLIVLCAFLAASPDLVWLYYEYIKPTKEKNRDIITKFHHKIQWSQTKQGFVVEFICFLIVFPSLIYLGIS